MKIRSPWEKVYYHFCCNLYRYPVTFACWYVVTRSPQPWLREGGWGNQVPFRGRGALPVVGASSSSVGGCRVWMDDLWVFHSQCPNYNEDELTLVFNSVFTSQVLIFFSFSFSPSFLNYLWVVATCFLCPWLPGLICEWIVVTLSVCMSKVQNILTMSFSLPSRFGFL